LSRAKRAKAADVVVVVEAVVAVAMVIARAANHAWSKTAYPLRRQ
jgi:hypothetical protein